MIDRREFLLRTAACLVTAASTGNVRAATEISGSMQTWRGANRSAHQRIIRIRSALRRDDTLVRHGGSGDNWHMSWAADNRQYVSLCDGYGWSERPKGMYNSRLLTIDGGPREAKFQEVAGYPPFIPSFDVPRYYGFGTLALDGRLYQFLSTWNVPISFPVDFKKLNPHELRFVGAKLIYSPDNGRTWCNQNGSSPVIWEHWRGRSRDTMLFFEEDQEAFSLLTVLQMGKNYEHNRDGYVYVYAPNGNTEGTMNELVMFRVHKAQILNRSAYEYFTGWSQGEGAIWSHDIAARAAVHTFPRGWVNDLVHPFAWHPSVVYNAPLGVYMMANWAPGVSANGMWFGKPSYLGLWAGTNPWGPWIQVHEETTWIPAGDAHARAFAPQIAPKWIAPDGKSFWLVWSDYQKSDDREFIQFFDHRVKRKYHSMRMSDDEWSQLARKMRSFRPFYGFNVQRVDLVVR